MLPQTTMTTEIGSKILSTSDLLLLLWCVLIAKNKEGSFYNLLPEEQSHLPFNLPILTAVGDGRFPYSLSVTDTTNLLTVDVTSKSSHRLVFLDSYRQTYPAPGGKKARIP